MHNNQEIETKVIDIETYSKEGKVIPEGAHYKFRVDKDIVTVEVSRITGREILDKAGRHPVEMYRLDMKLRGGAAQKIELDEVVDLTTPGLERFMTIRLEQTEG